MFTPIANIRPAKTSVAKPSDGVILEPQADKGTLAELAQEALSRPERWQRRVTHARKARSTLT